MLTLPPQLFSSAIEKCGAFSTWFNYYPHQQQLNFHASAKRFNVVAAGARAGKSMGGGAEVALQLLIPNSHTWLVSSIYELANKEFEWALDFLSRVKYQDRRLLDLARISNPQRGSKRIEFPWGSWAETKSTINLDNLLGEELDLLIMGEASRVPRVAWNRYLRARLGPRKGRAYFLSTPNWDFGLFKDLYDQGLSLAPEFRDYASFRFSVLANPTFDRAEYEAAKMAMDATVFAEQYDGEFVTRRGLVFPTFSSQHVYEKTPEYFEQWPVFLTWHHERNAYNNPIVALCVAVNPEDQSLWVFDYFHRYQTDVKTASAEIVKKIHGRRLVTTLTAFSNTLLQDELRKFWPSVTTNEEKKYSKRHSLVRRIQALQTALKVVEGKVKIHIHKSCVEVIQDFKTCKWPERKKEITSMAETECPTTKFISAPAALSYLVAFAAIAQGNDIYEVQRISRKRAAWQ